MAAFDYFLRLDGIPGDDRDVADADHPLGLVGIRRADVDVHVAQLGDLLALLVTALLELLKQLLDMTIADVYDLVFSRQLPSVEAPSGRRLVPRAAIRDWKTAQTSAKA